MIYFSIIYLIYSFVEWCTTFKYYSFISFVCSYFVLVSSADSPVFIIVSFTSISKSLESHKLDFSIENLNLIWLLVLYVTCESSFILTQLFFLNLNGLFGVLSKKILIFGVLLLCYYIFCLFLEIYIFLLSWCFITVYELFCSKVLEAFVTLSAILTPIRSAAASTPFWISLFEAVLNVFVADFLA